MVFILTAFVAFATFLVYYWTKRTLTYWSSKGIKGPKPVPLVGNFMKVFTFHESFDTLIWKIYNDYPGEKAVGFWIGFKPALLIKDAELLKILFIKDFAVFQDRDMKFYDGDRFHDNLFNATEETWRILRQKLSPIFTSGKLRTMTPLIQSCIDQYLNYVEKLVEMDKPLEARALSSKYTLEVIGTCAFGVDMATFTDAPNPFYETALLIFNPSVYYKTMQLLNFFIPKFTRFVNKYSNLPVENPVFKQFFVKLVNEIVNQREGKKKLRNDFMDLLIELKEQGKAERKDAGKVMEIEMDVELLAAQSFVFFAAGYETSSATMSFLMYELACNQDIQERLYQEINKVKSMNDGKISYESLSEMPYLEMCFDETLRKYPVVGVLMRRAGNKYTFPGTNFTLEKGQNVMVSVLGLHRDPELYKDPEVFDPERFSPENKSNIPRMAYLPFGEGPRNCIGMRFAKVQSMLGLAAFLHKFKVEKSEKTPDHIEFDPRALTVTSKEGIWLKISRR